ncbi:MAG TPA: SDR family oxidoreductase [Herpetosiphonaceae bacterium]
MSAAFQRGGTALITGASGGIGAELARVFAAKGHDLVLVARGETALRELAGSLERQHGIATRCVALDLSAADAPQALAHELAAAGIPVDILVNNAGFASYGPFAALDAAADLNMIQLNVAAVTHLCKLFLPPMLERRRGKILNIASTAAFQPGPLMAVYYATKAYVLSLSEALAEETRGTGVTVTALCPGPTASGFQARAAMEQSKLVKDRAIMDAATVAEEGYRALMGGRLLTIPGLQNRLGAFAVRLMPRRAVLKLVKGMQERAG